MVSTVEDVPCGTVNENLELRDRTFVCPCGWVCDRDHNAALNIHPQGRALSCVGDDVRPATAGAVVEDRRIPNPSEYVKV